jgi:hypothetical protein
MPIWQLGQGPGIARKERHSQLLLISPDESLMSPFCHTFRRGHVSAFCPVFRRATRLLLWIREALISRYHCSRVVFLAMQYRSDLDDQLSCRSLSRRRNSFAELLGIFSSHVRDRRDVCSRESRDECGKLRWSACPIPQQRRCQTVADSEGLHFGKSEIVAGPPEHSGRLCDHNFRARYFSRTPSPFSG